MNVKKVRILGKTWHLKYVPEEELHEEGEEYPHKGDCDPPDKKNKTIRISEALTDVEELDTLLHEFLHAAEWNMSEEWVDAAGRDIAHALWRLGWRKTGQED